MTWDVVLVMWRATSVAKELSVFGLDFSPGMLEQARKLNPDAFYAIVNIPVAATVHSGDIRVLKS